MTRAPQTKSPTGLRSWVQWEGGERRQDMGKFGDTFAHACRRVRLGVHSEGNDLN